MVEIETKKNKKSFLLQLNDLDNVYKNRFTFRSDHVFRSRHGKSVGAKYCIV